jgi:hypothetical protein
MKSRHKPENAELSMNSMECGITIDFNPLEENADF